MAEVNNGSVVGPVRLVVLDVDGSRRSSGPIVGTLAALFAGATVESRITELRVYDLDDRELARARFPSRRTAERARTLLASMADRLAAGHVDWRGELAMLANGAAR